VQANYAYINTLMSFDYFLDASDNITLQMGGGFGGLAMEVAHGW
jgi:hypothetical protein